MTKRNFVIPSFCIYKKTVGLDTANCGKILITSG